MLHVRFMSTQKFEQRCKTAKEHGETLIRPSDVDNFDKIFKTSRGTCYPSISFIGAYEEFLSLQHFDPHIMEDGYHLSMDYDTMTIYDLSREDKLGLLILYAYLSDYTIFWDEKEMSPIFVDYISGRDYGFSIYLDPLINLKSIMKCIHKISARSQKWVWVDDIKFANITMESVKDIIYSYLIETSGAFKGPKDVLEHIDASSMSLICNNIIHTGIPTREKCFASGDIVWFLDVLHLFNEGGRPISTIVDNFDLLTFLNSCQYIVRGSVLLPKCESVYVALYECGKDCYNYVDSVIMNGSATVQDIIETGVTTCYSNNPEHNYVLIVMSKLKCNLISEERHDDTYYRISKIIIIDFYDKVIECMDGLDMGSINKLVELF